MKAFVVVTDMGQYLIFATSEENAKGKFVAYCEEENILQCYEADYKSIYVLN